MKKRYLPLLIASLMLGSCAQELPGVPGKNQSNVENPDKPQTDPETKDFSQFKILLERLDLEDANLFRVKAALNARDSATAANELLRYFRGRTSLRNDVQHPTVDPSQKPTKPNQKENKPADGIIKQADDALNHLFLAHKSLAPIDYGKDIDWAKPHSDKEVMYQLHRMYWWSSMGQTYWYTLDEKYAKEWVLEVQDWITKNPCDPSSTTFAYAWRPLEIASRLADQPALFNYFITSEYFTPEFLVKFLNSLYEQAHYLWNNFPYDNGNHLVYSGNGCYIAGCLFPELKEATTWRNEGVKLLTEQLSAQVLNDGVQNEYTPKYQCGTISEFLQATEFAVRNNRTDFTQDYKDKIRQMIDVVIDFSVIHTNDKGNRIYQPPMFGDTDHLDAGLNKYFQTWAKSYPGDGILTSFANGSGEKTDWYSNAHTDGGFYTFRNAWRGTSVIMPIIAHPTEVWHTHPDVGTFELSINGRLFMPDPGYYKYAGDAQTNAERAKFRRSCIHNIMTLENKDIALKNVNVPLWKINNKSLQVIRIENDAYTDMKVSRTIFFNNTSANKMFIIVDEGIGNAEGNVQVHFNLCENSNTQYGSDKTKTFMYTQFSDNNNLLIHSFCPSDPGFYMQTITGDDAKISYEYGKTEQGFMAAFHSKKVEAETQQIVTVLYPFQGTVPPTITDVNITGSENTLKVSLKIDGTQLTFQP